MTFDLSNDLDKARFKSRVNFLYTRGKVVELTVKKEAKTLSQNRYLHLILGWFGKETGYTLEEVKQDIFKRMVCKKIFLIAKNDYDVYRSTADLSKEEMNICIEMFRNFAAKEVGIYLPEPGEEALIREMERELNRYDAWTT